MQKASHLSAPRKRKNAAASPPASTRQTRNKGGTPCPTTTPPNIPSENTEDEAPERPRKRPRPRPRVRGTGEQALDTISEEVPDPLEQSTVASPSGRMQSAAEILAGISSSTCSRSHFALGGTQTGLLQDNTNGDSTKGVENDIDQDVNHPGLPCQPGLSDSNDSSNIDDGEEWSEEAESCPAQQSKGKRAVKSSKALPPKPDATAQERIFELHFHLTARGMKTLKSIMIPSDSSYETSRDLMLSGLGLPRQKWEGRRLGIKMPDSRVADPPLELTELQYQETSRLLKDNAAALERQKKGNLKRKVPTIIDLKTYEAELAEKEARRSKKKNLKGKKKAELSDEDSDAPQADDNAADSGPAKTMTTADATKLLHSKRTCVMHSRLCRVLPDGLHIPWSVEAIAIWATLICEGKATPDEIPRVLKDDARPRAQESRRATSRDPTPAPVPQPIEIKMVYPNFPATPFPSTSSSSLTINPPSSPTMEVSTADLLIEDFLGQLDTRYQGRDFRNFKQYLSAFEEESIVRITELGDKEIRKQGANFYRQAPFNMPRGVANLFFTSLKAALKNPQGAPSAAESSAA
ncbi:hypothetical protein M407DRAFT_27914 [Tulasnella calospora MUT 4182]|uniref:Uncharacterized protein n=1 Tax=Tulasnella calospora MUT 4182 TaxID=1051891 RepID=A0A0C3QBN1_9AGAM|nr:hypothetical protein M407DRAFT_27914 [Tulasnella calospora MUT 4182]